MLNRKPTREEHIEHVALVRALTDAVESAISAIERNDLPQFEVHLATQETISNRLAATSPAAIASATETSDTSLLLEARRAYLALAQTNRVYAALLKRARTSLRIMAALYRAQQEGYIPGSPIMQEARTWSCEV